MRAWHLAAALAALYWAAPSHALPLAPQGWQLQTADSERVFSFARGNAIKYVYLMGKSYRTTRDE